jgi:hypothetical protein
VNLKAKTSSKTEFDERQQMGRLLHAAAEDNLISYPIEVTHTSLLIPDFTVSIGGRRIGVEASRIANEAKERFDELPESAFAHSPSPFLVNHPKMTNDELVEAAWNDVEWNDSHDEVLFWLQQAERTLKRKSLAHRRPTYRRHDSDWLLLWDRLTQHEGYGGFSERVAILQGFWDKTWRAQCPFAHVIIANEDFSKHAVLTQHSLRFIEGAV